MKALRTIALGFSFLIAAAAANAQALTVQANIPFSFVVGNHELPAGQYDVRPGIGNAGILSVRSSDGTQGALAITSSCTNRNWSGNTELVFHRVGQRYFLSSIRVEGYEFGRQLPKNRAEQEAEQVAFNQKSDNVVIFAELVNR
jgi:hypothetical protein